MTYQFMIENLLGRMLQSDEDDGWIIRREISPETFVVEEVKKRKDMFPPLYKVYNELYGKGKE